MGKGGSSSSSTAVSTTNQSTDKRLVMNDGIGLSSDSSSVSISVLDGGAIAAAQGIIEDGIEAISASQALNNATQNELIAAGGNLFASALDFLRESQSTVNAAVARESEAVSTAYSNAKGSGYEQYALVAGIVLIGGIVAVKALGK